MQLNQVCVICGGSSCNLWIIFWSYSYQTMKTNMHKFLSLTLILALTVMAYAQGRPGSASQQQPVSQQQFDVNIRGGMVYDGTCRAPVKPDVGIRGDRIAAVGNLSRATAPTIDDAKGLAVAPG